MEQLKVTLNRQIGPFKLWQWLLVLVGGIALGLMVRNRFSGFGGGKDEESTLGATDDLEGLTPTQGAPTIVQQDFESVTALQQQQDRFQDELENIETGLGDRIEDLFTEVTERIDKIKIPVMPKPRTPGRLPFPKPQAPKTTTKPKADPCSDPSTYPTYTVKRGDTMKRIGARLYGSEGKWATHIRPFNNPRSGNWDLIFPGEKFKYKPKNCA